MSYVPGWRTIVAALGAALALAACGGGGSDSPAAATPSATGSVAPPPSGTAIPPVADASAPTLSGNIAADGRNWINYRRAQAGVPAVAENAQINAAALGHSEYLRVNNLMSHDQVPGRQGFTGATLADRLAAAGYTLPTNGGYAYGEIISGTTNRSGFYMAEELITAIYHRFVMFEPMFKEIGTGAATSSSGYNYFTADFGARGGYGPGIARGTIVTWPFNGQAQVTPNFYSDTEAPDPVPSQNEVGYPISVHTNLDASLTVQSFTVRPRGGANLTTQRVDPSGGQKTAAAIVPLQPLKGGTTYEVSFSGAVNGAPVTREWSFTTR
ncbi:CAP domain-containing protein [Massilia sp. ST3]|uniref:CAP domain-containing protein n=1 Tax=Massilia sp. ST3 TaxID=2824903 RepID=UPI001B82F062|nr:CAP domain-containing protein [Massilia sp. ST3]MBQ5948763.1 CAP domain-containing protein [Massilia sp. ST3]